MLNCDCSEIQTHYHLVCKQTLNHLTKQVSLAKWLSANLWTKWLWVQILLQSLKLQISHLFWESRSDIQATIECSFTEKRISDMIRTYRHCIVNVNEACIYEREIFLLKFSFIILNLIWPVSFVLSKYSFQVGMLLKKVCAFPIEPAVV